MLIQDKVKVEQHTYRGYDAYTGEEDFYGLMGTIVNIQEDGRIDVQLDICKGKNDAIHSFHPSELRVIHIRHTL